MPWTLLSADEIDAVIPVEQRDDLVINVCFIGPTPGSNDPDVLNELAYRVDAGGVDLIAGYAATSYAELPEECNGDEGGLVDISPLLAVEYEGERYGILPGSDWCAAIQPERQALLDALVLVPLVNETVRYEEERG